MRFLSGYGKIIKNVRREAMDLTNDIKMANATKKYILQNKEDPIYDYVTPDGLPIGAWLVEMKIAMRNGTLTNLQILLLKTCGIDFRFWGQMEEKSLTKIRLKRDEEFWEKIKMEEEYWILKKKNLELKTLEEKKQNLKRAWNISVKNRIGKDEEYNKKIFEKEDKEWEYYIRNSIIEKKIRKEYIKMIKRVIENQKGEEIRRKERVRENLSFLRNTNSEECVKNFMNCTNNKGAELFYVTKAGVVGNKVIIKKFSKEAILKCLRYYKNRYMREYKCPVTGKINKCYVVYVLTQFNSSYFDYPIISKIYLDVWNKKEFLRGGVYCEGQEYIRLNHPETCRAMHGMEIYWYD